VIISNQEQGQTRANIRPIKFLPSSITNPTSPTNSDQTVSGYQPGIPINLCLRFVLLNLDLLGRPSWRNASEAHCTSLHRHWVRNMRWCFTEKLG